VQCITVKPLQIFHVFLSTQVMSSFPSWAQSLQHYNHHCDGDTHAKSYDARLEEATEQCLSRTQTPTSRPAAKLCEIPKFYDATRSSLDAQSSFAPMDELAKYKHESWVLANEVSRELFLDNHEERLLSEHDLDHLLKTMLDLIASCRPRSQQQQPQLRHNTSEQRTAECWMDYELFKELKQSLPCRTHKFFTPLMFAKFPMNERGEIDGLCFHQFVSYALNLLHQYITLCRYEICTPNNSMWNGKSFLTESDLEIFIQDQIEMIPFLNRIDAAFHPYYVFHAVRKFVFFLSSEIDNNTKPIAVTKILCSDIFRELNMFRFSCSVKTIGDDNDDAAQSVMQQQLNAFKNNWFSVENALRVYKMYLELDVDHNGTLSQKEMLQFAGSSLSNLCIQRIFQYKKTWDGEMDYKGFLNFVLAMECKSHVCALNYWWDILDVDGNGYLTPLNIHTLFRSVQKKMGVFGLDPINSEDVLNEIIDMVHPKDLYKITKHDLIHSKMHHIVTDILTNVKGFWEYENRESMINQDQN